MQYGFYLRNNCFPFLCIFLLVLEKTKGG
uniref:Uncharacterized protein n=1 Tax=Arundo donax TaxID=35708 RepID=A0A0A9H119_ARUDO